MAYCDAQLIPGAHVGQSGAPAQSENGNAPSKTFLQPLGAVPWLLRQGRRSMHRHVVRCAVSVSEGARRGRRT
jgi:hypothetical protein